MTPPDIPPEGDRRKSLPRRKDDYADLEKKIDDKYELITLRIQRFIAKALVVMAIIGLGCAAGLGGFALALHRIQVVREGFIRDNCNAQNQHHDDTVAEFDRLAEIAIAKDPKQKKQIQKSQKTTTKLVDALQPKQDCDLLVKVARGDAEPPPPVTNPQVKEKTP